MREETDTAPLDLPADLTAVYPWQEDIWQQWQARCNTDAVPHAVLLSGDAGIGKAHLALSMAAHLLCSDREHAPCGQCPECRFLQAGTHADFHYLQPGGDSKWIRIDQIREVIDALNLTAQRGRYKVAILAPADSLNTAAANALLKTLEEPSADTVLFLVSARPARLPATIRSRCQQLALATPQRAAALAWLATQAESATLDAREREQLLDLAAGAPLRALALAREGGLAARVAAFEAFAGLARGKGISPVSVAAEWGKEGLDTALFWLYGWVHDLILLRQLGGDIAAPALRNRDLAGALQGLANPLDLKALHDWLGRIRGARRFVSSSVNAGTVVEDLLLDWVKVSAPHRR